MSTSSSSLQLMEYTPLRVTVFGAVSRGEKKHLNFSFKLSCVLYMQDKATSLLLLYSMDVQAR